MLSSHRYRIRPSNGNTLLVCLDMQGKIRSVSGPLVHFLNYKAENFVGLDFSSLIVPNDRLSFESLFNPRVDRSEFGIYRLDGSVMFADVLIFDVVDEDDRVSGHVFFVMKNLFMPISAPHWNLAIQSMVFKKADFLIFSKSLIMHLLKPIWRVLRTIQGNRYFLCRGY